LIAYLTHAHGAGVCLVATSTAQTAKDLDEIVRSDGAQPRPGLERLAIGCIPHYLDDKRQRAIPRPATVIEGCHWVAGGGITTVESHIHRGTS
jgi:hypothetical protein